METGTTGIREATVLVPESPKRPADAQEPIVLNEGEDLFEQLRDADLRPLPAYEERWDASFPDHPLSKVRAGLADVVATLKLAPEAQALAPYRVVTGRKRWWLSGARRRFRVDKNRLLWW